MYTSSFLAKYWEKLNINQSLFGKSLDGNDIDIPEIVLTNSTLSEMETYRHNISLEWKY